MSTQNLFAIMEWPTDGHKLSIHRLGNIIQPAKQWNDYVVGDTGTSKYPGCPGDWPFIIRAVGPSKKSLEKAFADLLKAKQNKSEETVTELATTGTMDAPIAIIGKEPSDATESPSKPKKKKSSNTASSGQLRTSPRKKAPVSKSSSESTSEKEENQPDTEMSLTPKNRPGPTSSAARMTVPQGHDSGPNWTLYSEKLASGGECKHKCNCESKIKALSDEVSRLRRRVRKLESRDSRLPVAPVSPAAGPAICSTPPGANISNPGPNPSQLAAAQDQGDLNQTPSDSALSALANAKNTSEAIKKVALALFSKEELRDSSITGKKTVQCGGDPRPPLDQFKLERVFRVMMARDTSLSRSDIVRKLQNTQKVIRRK